LCVALRVARLSWSPKSFIFSRPKKRCVFLLRTPQNSSPMTLVQGNYARTMRAFLIQALATDVVHTAAPKLCSKCVHTMCRSWSRTDSSSVSSVWKARLKRPRSPTVRRSNRTIRPRLSHSGNSFCRGMLSPPGCNTLPPRCALTKPRGNGRISRAHGDPPRQSGGATAVHCTKEVIMQITVKLFALMREKAGTDTVTLDIPAGATLAQAIAALVCHYPMLEPYMTNTRCALHMDFV